MLPRSLRRILVTGGAGFIGSHTCKALAREGVEPVVYDNLSRGHRDAVKWGPLIVGDIRDPETLDAVFSSNCIDAVIHFAALAYVDESVEAPGEYYDVNVGGTVALLQSMRRAGVARIVFSSSCATYGVPDRLPIAEDAPLRPVNPYGRSKLVCEQMLADFERAHGLRFAALRYFNAAGADRDGELGERHAPETHIVPRALMVAAGLLRELEIFGDDYPTPDGTCIRDFIHVDDLAYAHVRALGVLKDINESFCVNLGTGRGYSIKELLDVVEGVTGREIPKVIKLRRPGDPPALYADASLARELLGLIPRHSDLETIVGSAWSFISRRR